MGGDPEARLSVAFELHPRLSAGSFALEDLDLCAALLKDDSRWPWLVLVPRIEGAREWHDLDAGQVTALACEIAAASQAIADLDGVAKVNVGALGNQVEQLHVHIVGRWPGDPAWPDPVWGKTGKIAYAPEEAAPLAARIGLRLRA